MKKMWNEEVETLSLTDIEQRSIQALNKLFESLRVNEFYKDRVPHRNIKSFEELAELPFIKKTELMKEQMEHPPLGRYVNVSMQEIIRIQGTGGTTGRPLLTALTRRDANIVAEVGARGLWASGLRPDDIVFHVFNYSMYSGGVTDHMSGERLGATVIPIGVKATDTFIQLARQLHPTAIHGTPSYPFYLARKLQEDYQIDPHKLGIKKGFFGAEPGAGMVEVQKQLFSLFGMTAMNANYGLSEVLSLFASECEYRQGLHFVGGPEVILELIDPDSGESLPIRPGVEGEAVYTMTCYGCVGSD